MHYERGALAPPWGPSCFSSPDRSASPCADPTAPSRGSAPLGAQLGLLRAHEWMKSAPLWRPQVWLVKDEDPWFCLGSKSCLPRISAEAGAGCCPPVTQPSFSPDVASGLSFAKVLSQEAPWSIASQNGLLLGGPTSSADSPDRPPCPANFTPPQARLPTLQRLRSSSPTQAAWDGGQLRRPAWPPWS